MDNQSSIDIRYQIKEFLSKENQFRNPTFDPAPFIIDILKEKEANHELMIQRQNELIELQNQAQELIEQLCGQYNEDFLQLLNLPLQFGEELQKLKSNISIVKKKVKETKSLLQSTQKDIEQIYFNCLYNKLIYKKLKEIELRLKQYETASLALKNNQFMKCSMNLPFIQGKSILQSTLASRSDVLRLRMMSRAIEEVNLFIYLSPKIVTQSNNIMLERTHQEGEIILNWNEHQPFFKRYRLFKKADCEDYLKNIWKFQDLERKEGKIAMIYDIVKGSMNIGKISEISDSIKLNAKKLIGNIFLLLKCFYLKETQQLPQQQQRWFVDKNQKLQQFKVFFSNVLCICGVILRKLILVRKIYNQFENFDEKFHSGAVYGILLEELKELLNLTCFPALIELNDQIEGNSQTSMKILMEKLSQEKNYILYGCVEWRIRKCLKIIQTNVQQIEEDFTIDCQFQNQLPLFESYSEEFHLHFYKDYIKSLEVIFSKDGRSFTVELFEAIVEEYHLNVDEIKFMRGYRSEDKKAIKEYVLMLSFLKAVDEYWKENHLSQEKYLKYCLWLLMFFYLKLNNYFTKHAFTREDWKEILQLRKNSKKLKQKEQNFSQTYSVLIPNDFSKEKKIKDLPKPQEQQQAMSFKVLDRLRIFKIQNQMLLSFCCLFFEWIQGEKNEKDNFGYLQLIEKLQPANYDDNIKAKLTRIWDTLPQSEKYLRQGICITIQRIMVLHLCVNSKIFQETGIY